MANETCPRIDSFGESSLSSFLLQFFGRIILQVNNYFIYLINDKQTLLCKLVTRLTYFDYLANTFSRSVIFQKISEI